MQQYLQRHKYGCAETNDLWKALSDASGKDCNTFMQAWTRSVGFPVVSVREGVKQPRKCRVKEAIEENVAVRGDRKRTSTVYGSRG
jgi:aminopeptidase N